MGHAEQRPTDARGRRNFAPDYIEFGESIFVRVRLGWRNSTKKEVLRRDQCGWSSAGALT